MRVRDERDAGKRVAIDLISADVVVVVMRVHDRAHGLVRDAPQRSQHLLGDRRRAIRVHHDDVVIIDDEDVIGLDHQARRVFTDDGVDPVGQLLDVEVRGLSQKNDWQQHGGKKGHERNALHWRLRRNSRGQ